MNCPVREYSVFRALRQEQQFPAAGALRKLRKLGYGDIRLTA